MSKSSDSKHSHPNIQSVVNRLPIVIAYLDKDLRYRVANETYREWFGWDPQQMIGKSIYDLVGPTAAALSKPYLERALNGEKVEYRAELPYLNGKRFIKANYDPDFDENGNVIGIFATVSDISEQMKARADLEASESSYRTIFNATNVGISAIDIPSGKWLDANRKFQEMTGYTVDELKAFTPNDITHPDDLEKDIERREKFFRQEVPNYQTEKRYVRKDGRLIWVRIDSSIIMRDSNGKPLRSLGTVQDITSEKLAIESLRESEAYFRELVDTSPAMIWITDKDSQCTYLSQRWYDYTGRSPEQDLGFGWLENIHPEDLPKTSETYTKAVEAKGRLSIDYRLRRHDGTYRWMIDIGYPRLSKDGEFLGYIGIVTDVHDRVEAVSNLREVTTRFFRSAKASDLGVWYCDLPFDELIWNDEVKNHFFLPKDARVTIDTFYERMHPDDRKTTQEAIAYSIANRAPYDMHFRTTNPKNTSEFKWIRAIGWADYDAKGEPIRFDGITLDATEELKRNAELVSARDEAERANQLKSAFLANMSHEIRTPLNAILGFADLLRDSKITEAERNNFLNIINRNGAQLSVLINDILDLSKVEAGHLMLENVAVDPRRLANDVVSLLEFQAKEKNLKLEIQIEDTAPKQIAADPTRVRQILVNLVGNSIKFTHAGEITLKISGAGDKVCFTVTDTGIGIPSEQIDKIFGLFVQGDGSMTRRFGGTGLGLTLSRRLARSMGGDIEILRSELGKGSTFQVTIASRATTTETSPVIERTHAQVPTSTERPLSGKHILVVDDSKDNQHLMMRTLVKRGATVDLASDGQEALDKASFDKHDLVLMDIQMPVMDGYTATQKLRDRGFSKPIIALTAHAMSEVRKKVLSVGCTDHLSKPINTNELVKVILEHSSS